MHDPDCTRENPCCDDLGPYHPDAVDAEIAECERLEELARTEEALAELRESTDLAYEEAQHARVQ